MCPVNAESLFIIYYPWMEANFAKISCGAPIYLLIEYLNTYLNSRVI